jgi:hypothetical protein
MKKSLTFHFFGIILLLWLPQAGCVYFTKAAEIRALRQIASSQKEIEGYVKRQENGFQRLRQDIAENKLEKGLSKKQVISRYEEPVFCKPLSQGPAVESCLYRLPAEYFNTDSVYLFFDGSRMLESWASYPLKQIK